MFTLMRSKNRGTNRQQIAIKSVRDNIALLPHGQYRAILEVSPINFELRSEEEQDAIIDMYESFLNSMHANLQILIRTREIDMDKYLQELHARLEDESELIYRQQLEHYDEFIRSLIRSNKILSRHFYIVIPFSSASHVDFELIREQIQLAVDIVSKGVMRLGMHTRRLNSLEILDLFYSFYAPAQAKRQPLTEQALRLVHTTFIQKESQS